MQHRHIAEKFWTEGADLALDAQAPRRYNDFIDPSIGDTDFVTDKHIIEGALHDAKAGYTKYGGPRGDPELIDAIAAGYKTAYNMTLSPDEVAVTASSCFGMELALLSILNPGDEVLVFSPYFTPYKTQIELAGGICVEVPTYEADGYAIREDVLRAHLTDRTRALIFNNPANPTGAFCGRESMALLQRVTIGHDLIVLADEIYARFLFTGEDFLPLRALEGMAERTITLNSFSKNYMMTGWRVGCIVAAPHFTRTIQRINALPYLSVPQPKGTFYLFPDCTKTNLSSQDFCHRLFADAHILAVPGNAFGTTGEGHFRIACTVSTETLREAFDRMEKLTF